jgi:hypothetical protein
MSEQSVTQREVFLDDAARFKTLQSVSSDDSSIDRMKPQDIDLLGEEINAALDRCCVRGTTVSENERKVNAFMLNSIERIHQRLLVNSRGDSGPMLRLFFKTIITHQNLEAILRMCDMEIRSGSVRCHAFSLVHRLTDLGDTSIWNVRMKDGKVFTLHLVSTYAKAMEDETTKEVPHGENCMCKYLIWRQLSTALAVSKGKHLEILERLRPFNWIAILESEKNPSQQVEDEVCYWDYMLFQTLHRVAVRVLQKDPTNAKAEAFLRQIGASHELFCRLLRRMISGEHIGTHLIKNMKIPFDFFMDFIHCLAPLPADSVTDALMVQARASIFMPFMTSLMDPEAILAGLSPEASTAMITNMNLLLSYMETPMWTTLKAESDRQRWERFHYRCLSGDVATKQKQADKELRRGVRLESKEHLEAKVGKSEMCNNCYALEEDLGDIKLLTCGQCRLIKYCSRDCQRAHWKKAHREQCAGKKS